MPTSPAEPLIEQLASRLLDIQAILAKMTGRMDQPLLAVELSHEAAMHVKRDAPKHSYSFDCDPKTGKSTYKFVGVEVRER